MTDESQGHNPLGAIYEDTPGISYRQWLIGQALADLAGFLPKPDAASTTGPTADTIACMAIELADAVMARLRGESDD